MNAELLAMLGGSMPGASSRRENEPKTILSFKAGKMIAERQPSGKYMVTPDPRRGTLEVNWTASSSSSSAGVLKLEWKDRRTRAVVDTFPVFPEDDCTYSKVDTGPGREKDRVYLLQYGNASERRIFFWMQEKEEGNQDEEFCIKINTFMADPEEAAAAATGKPKKEKTESKKKSEKSSDADASTGQIQSSELQAIMQGLNTSAGGEGNAAPSPGQVDALSNILGNLGIPQNTNASASTASGNTDDAAAPAGSGGLTLSDLQGAMAGLATTSPTSATSASIQAPGPNLADVATSENVIESGILENEEVKQKLIELLPENQRTEEHLMENLRSPQVRQCLASLSAALCDEGMDGFNSILANFSLRPEDGAIAMMSGNPIQAFLDCVLKSVQREKEEEGKNDDAEMK